MDTDMHSGAKKGTLQLATFYIGDALFGIDIVNVQEISKFSNLTDVPQSPDFVLGIMNLRGRIITVLDLGRKLGLNSTVTTEKTRNIIVDSRDEFIGLLVDRIADVVSVDRSKIEAAPPNVKGVKDLFLQGVVQTQRDLIALLSVEEVCK